MTERQIHELRQRWMEQLPMIAAMCLDEDMNEPRVAAEIAYGLIEACLDVIQEKDD